MSEKCFNCKNAEILVGGHTGTRYLECKLEKDFANNATMEELYYMITHKDELQDAFCKYVEGKPSNGGITYDD